MLIPLSCQVNTKTVHKTQETCPGGLTDDIIKIIFYNVENLFDTFDDSTKADEEYLPGGLMHWTYSRYKTKLEKVCKVIVAAGGWTPPDMIGLAEIENSRVLLDLIHKTPLVKFEYRYVHKNSPDTRGIDVALLYNPATIKILKTEFIAGKSVDNTEKPTRDILYCKVSVRRTDTLHVFVNHWPSRSGGILETEPARMKMATILRRQIDSIVQSEPHQKIILMGDFNDGPCDKSLARVLKALPATDNATTGILYNLSSGYETKNRIGTHKFQGQWNMLDQIIVSGELLTAKKGLKTSPSCFSVFAPPYLLTEDKKYTGQEPFRTYKGPVYIGGFSDHLPVVVNLY